MDVCGAQGVVEVALVQHHAHLRLGLLLLGDVVIAHKSDGACVPADQIQDALDGGGFTRAVFSDEAHDGPAGELQIDVVQGKVAVGLAKAGYFNTVCHNHSP